MRFTHEYACWVDASNSQNGPLIPAVAKEITVGGATFDMHQPIKLPKTLFFYFTRDRQIGRRCLLLSQKELNVAVAFQGRIGASPTALIDLRQRIGRHADSSTKSSSAWQLFISR